MIRQYIRTAYHAIGRAITVTAGAPAVGDFLFEDEVAYAFEDDVQFEFED
jgi:hypothetical protein